MTFFSSYLDFASDEVFDLIAAKLEELDTIEDFLTHSSSIPALGVVRGRLFERFAHNKFERGGDFPIFPLSSLEQKTKKRSRSPTTTTFTIRRTKVVRFGKQLKTLVDVIKENTTKT